MAHCLQCGKKIPKGYRYCFSCGKLDEERGAGAMPSADITDAIGNSAFVLGVVAFFFVISGLLLWLGYQAEDTSKADAARRGAYAGLVFRLILVILASVFSVIVLLT